MSILYGNGKQLGGWSNGNASSEFSSNTFNYPTITPGAGIRGSSAFDMNINSYGSSIVGGEFYEVDTSKMYQFVVTARTYQLNYNGNLGSGHLGFDSYDKNFNRISLVNLTISAPTTLSRPATPGDTKIYVSSNAGWYASGNNIFAYLCFYPATHPDYSTPYQYTRLNPVYDSTLGPVATGTGDFELTLTAPLPNWGYDLPAGTPVGNGRAGSTYNYPVGSPNIPQEWTTYSALITGENILSTTGFRNSTKYVRFINLINYNTRFESSGNSARYYVDHVYFIERPSRDAIPPIQFQTGRFSQ
jgi:hypothetical protein